MNQQCKVCGEPAAGFHFGAFTCEGCKSFFGRSYNNLSSISECKNGGECVINKKNRTACKACRLRKCLLVGMSKSGSRYGRRSNWFKIHCLLQEQQQQQQQQQQHHQQQQQQQQQQYQQSLPNQQHHLSQSQRKPLSPPIGGLHGGQRKDDVLSMGLDDYKNSTSPSISSPESHNSDSSIEMSERRAAFAGHPGFRPLHAQIPHTVADLSAFSKEMMSLPLGFHLGGMSLIPQSFLPPPSLTMFSPYHLYAAAPHGVQHSSLSHHSTNLPRHSPEIANDNTTVPTSTSRTNPLPLDITTEDKDACHNNNNNNDGYTYNNNNARSTRRSVSPCVDRIKNYSKRFYLDAVLKSQRISKTKSATSDKTSSGQESTRESPELEVDCPPPQDNPIDLSMKSNILIDMDIMEDEEVDVDSNSDRDSPLPKRRPGAINLTTKS